ncbi:MAG: DUF3761 domain-containing protein [Gemmatimonadetes bacterium]|nr:DUF3761 domain-containing protein [Gemmatimonadota bacterium]
MTSLRMLLASCFLLAAVAASLAAQDPPRTLPAASPPPTAPAPAPKVVAPPANAVAQCNDLTFVVPPAQPAACGTRGGVKLTLPGVRPAPAAPATTPSVRAAAAQPAANARNDAPPAGATMRCRDGTWLSGTPSESRCDRNGGLAVILPAPRAAPARVP